MFTALQGEHAQRLNDTLSKQGFRRSQNVLYRPSCAECSACLSARIRVADFEPNRTQRKVLKKAANLRRNATSPWATEDQFALFRRYLDARHADGGMADMDIFEFAAMIEETPVLSRVIEYYADDEDGQEELIGACLTDILDDGLSLVYSFFDPEQDRRSFGGYIIQDHIKTALEAGLPYVYLGFWVPGSQKMAYKSRYQPLEIFRSGAWRDFDTMESVTNQSHPLDTDPVSEQVAAIHLPDLS